MGHRATGLPQAPSRFESPTSAQGALCELVGRETITHATYFGINVPTLSARRDYVLTTYPTDWAKHYFEQGYDEIDPVVKGGMRGIMPFDWASIDAGATQIQAFFGEAREFGIGDRGVSIPIRGASGDEALFSVTSHLSLSSWKAFKTETLGALTLFAFQFHQCVLEMEMRRRQIKPVSLSSRERELLKWAAAGKSTWDTAQILGLSENTVRFYLSKVQAKLGAANKPNAVAIAIRQKLI